MLSIASSKVVQCGINMEHNEFIRAWKNSEIEVVVDRSKAFQNANSKMLPKRYRYAHILWSWVWIISIPTALAVMFFYDWWAGILFLLLTFIPFKSTKKSAMQFIIVHSLENADFYHFSIENGVIRVRPKRTETKEI